MNYNEDIFFSELYNEVDLMQSGPSEASHEIDLTQSSPSDTFHEEASIKRKKPRPYRRNKWTQNEDDALRQLVAEFGDNDWKNISSRIEGRNLRQCRERWQYYLNPDLNHGNWTKEEDELLFQKREELGAKWTLIAKFFVNRTDAMIKTRYNSLVREMKKEKANNSENNIQTNLQAPKAQEAPQSSLFQPQMQQPIFQTEVFQDFQSDFTENDEEELFTFIDSNEMNYFTY